jgi:mRNA interferase RelE/StbE
MAHSIDYVPSARKALNGLPQNTHKRVINALLTLADNPRPHGCKKLTGREEYRIRIGSITSRITYFCSIFGISVMT